METEPKRGGFKKPISTREFILDHLSKKGEAYIADMHRAYKEALATIAREAGRKHKYVYPRYHNFQGQVWKLAQEGLIEISRTEPTRGLHDQFKGFEKLPEKHYYRRKEG